MVKELIKEDERHGPFCRQRDTRPTGLAPEPKQKNWEF